MDTGMCAKSMAMAAGYVCPNSAVVLLVLKAVPGDTTIVRYGSTADAVRILLLKLVMTMPGTEVMEDMEATVVAKRTSSSTVHPRTVIANTARPTRGDGCKW